MRRCQGRCWSWRTSPRSRPFCATSSTTPASASLVAGDAEEALTVLDERQVVCAVVDVMLPGASGFDLCRRVRETSDLPLLFLTARGDDSDKLRGLGLGADDYIVKSATPAEVVARVKAVLRRAPAALVRDGRLARVAVRTAVHRPRGARGGAR